MNCWAISLILTVVIAALLSWAIPAGRINVFLLTALNALIRISFCFWSFVRLNLCKNASINSPP